MATALAQFAPTAIAAIVAVFAVWFTSRLASLRAHDDRVWSKKADAYGAILQALETRKSCYIAWLQEDMHGTEVSTEVENMRRGQNSDAERAMASTIASYSWLLDDAVEARCTALSKELQTKHDSWFEHVDSVAFEIGRTQIDLAQIAKRELGKPKLFK